jgi:ribonuclease HI
LIRNKGLEKGTKMMESKNKMNAVEAIEISLREKRVVKIKDVDGEQELVLNQICDNCCSAEATVDFWGVREGDEWHVCITKESTEV